MTTAVLPASVRHMVEGNLPVEIEPLWWETGEELVALAPEAEIGWFDMFDKTDPLRALAAAVRLKWLNSIFAGVDWMPLDELDRRGVILTNGAGINANSVAEFALMSMLAVARNYADIVRGQDRHEWVEKAAGSRELAGSRVLVMGYGSIGQAIARMCRGFDAEVTAMRRRGGAGCLGPHEWRERIGEFDWIVLAMPGTPETKDMIDADVLASMKSDAVLVNVARADIVNQSALAERLTAGKLGAAILDLTDPEPIGPDHYLWDVPNCHVTMHQAGLPTPATRQRAVDRFLTNCENYLNGEAMISRVDLSLGY